MDGLIKLNVQSHSVNHTDKTQIAAQLELLTRIVRRGITDAQEKHQRYCSS
jgi:ribosomal protein S18